MVRGVVSDIQRFSPHDGPGIRTTVFLKGCPLQCVWCHNPELMPSEPAVLVRPERCMRCGACAEACPERLAAPTGRGDGGAPEPRHTVADPDVPGGATDTRCVACGRCADVCPTGARERLGREMTPGEVADEVARDRVFFEESGGGVTFSGGEPLTQHGFLAACLERLRAREIHTVVDTCGHARAGDLLAVAAVADLFLFDLKVADPEHHRRLTGVSNETILANLRLLAGCHDAIWLRIPVVPGWNDDPADLDATARLAACLPAVRRVCLLPYHRGAVSKVERLGERSAVRDVVPPDPARMRAIADRFEAAGVLTTIGA